MPLYLIRFPLGPLPTTLLECMIGTLVVIWIVRDNHFFPTLGSLWRHHRFLAVFLFLFLTAATISIFVSGNLRAAAGIWRAYFIEPALVFLVAFDVLRTKEQLSRVICASATSALIVATIAVYQRFTGWHIPAPWLSELRVTSVYSYPNAVGLYLAPIIPLCVVQFFDSLKSHKSRAYAALYACAGMVSLLAIYFAKTEAALVALAVVLPLMGLIWSMKTRLATMVVCAALSAIIFATPGLSASIQEKLSLRDWSGQVRQKIWKETRAMLADRTVFGAGLAGYQQAIEPYHKAKHLEIFLYPHNIALNFWTETGLLGFFSFILIVLSLFF
ncbi:MAG: O-antigen ligase family protein, partial [Candidatus Uhrbacteria bacterium]|nr:O-antigen ligase family protein [Candidatus Uhrbacteria bacterium]